MKKRIIGLVCLLLSAAGALAAHWTINPYAFQYDMTVYAVLQTGGKAISSYSDYEVAAFCGNECRGVAKVQTATDGSKYLYIRIRSNKSTAETISLRVYLTSTNEEQTLEETINFETMAVIGTPSEPMALTLTQSSITSGDINGNGEVDDEDVDAFIELYLDDEVPEAGTPEFNNFDANGDGIITLADAVAIFYLSNGLNYDGTDPNAATVRHGLTRSHGRLRQLIMEN